MFRKVDNMGYKVAVLMGGTSYEREFSLASGKRVCEALREAGHTVVPLDTTDTLVETLRAEAVDVAYIALHGKHGEDGTIQSLLEFLDIPFVGSPATVCRLTWNKSTLPHVLNAHRLGVGERSDEGPAFWPDHVCLSIDAFKNMGVASALKMVEGHITGGYPYAVKPASGGSALGLHKVAGFSQLSPAVLDALSYDDEVLIEKWVEGTELAVSIIEDPAQGPRVLPIVEICPKVEMYDTTARLDADAVDYYAPVRPESLAADPDEAQRCAHLIEEAALEAYRAYGCRDLARIDLIWDGTVPRLLEVDISPGMTALSLLPTACAAAGLSLKDVLSDLLDTAVARG
jgi:D-alanine-D-alanine ligase